MSTERRTRARQDFAHISTPASPTSPQVDHNARRMLGDPTRIAAVLVAASASRLGHSRRAERKICAVVKTDQRSAMSSSADESALANADCVALHPLWPGIAAFLLANDVQAVTGLDNAAPDLLETQRPWPPARWQLRRVRVFLVPAGVWRSSSCPYLARRPVQQA